MPTIQPKFIAIDSSLLGNWASDAFSTDFARKEQAAKMSEELFAANWVPVLYWHHFEEMVRHADDEVVENRVKFLRSLPLIAWVSRADSRTEIIGSVVDLHAFEIKTFLSLNQCSTTSREFIQTTRVDLLEFGKPSDISMFSMWRELRPYLVGMGSKQQEIASICHTTKNAYDKVPLIALNNKTVILRNFVNQIYSEEFSSLRDELVKKGDKRLSDHHDLAAKFCDIVFSNLAAVSEMHRPLAEAFVENFGFSIKNFREDVTLGEFKEIVRRRKQLGISVEQLGLLMEDVWPKLQDCLMPSEEVISQIRKSRKSAVRASGSDLNDDYHATLIPYLDAVVVDKRTHENLRQAMMRKPELTMLLKSAMKASFYYQIPAILRRKNNLV